MPWTNPDARRAGTVHLGGTFAEIAATERDIHAGRLPERPSYSPAGINSPTQGGQPATSTRCRPAHVPHGYTGDATEAIVAQIERFARGSGTGSWAGPSGRPRRWRSTTPTTSAGKSAAGTKNIRQVVFGPRATFSPLPDRRARHVRLLGSDPTGPRRARDVRRQRGRRRAALLAPARHRSRPPRSHLAGPGH